MRAAANVRTADREGIEGEFGAARQARQMIGSAAMAAAAARPARSRARKTLTASCDSPRRVARVQRR